jgi:hypothetical protein
MGPNAEMNWFDRNWKWFAPLACLWGLAVIVGFCALIVYFVFGLMKSSDVYKEALARAKANPAVVRALGVPIEEGLFVSGSIQVSGPSGNADLAIPLSGPRGKGKVFLEARKSAGRWSFSKLLVEVDETKERIDLLRPGEVPLPPESSPDKESDITI